MSDATPPHYSPLPAWYLWHVEREKYDAEREGLALDAWGGLIRGDLNPLALLLQSPVEGIPALVRRELVNLIEGPAESNGRRLRFEKHPDLSHIKQGPWERNIQAMRNFRIANFVEANGGREQGQHESAIHGAMAEFGLKRSRVEAIWSTWLRSCQIWDEMSLSNET